MSRFTSEWGVNYEQRYTEYGMVMLEGHDQIQIGNYLSPWSRVEVHNKIVVRH